MPPRKVQWSRQRHTQAKHQVLEQYLAAWIPILATQGKHVVLIDGFAGPGRYADAEPGSPLIMLDAYARRADRARLGVTAHFFFIEQHPRRAAALQAETDKRKKTSDIEVRVIAGDYETELPKLLEELRMRWPLKLPPIFAFIDPFGAGDNRLDLTSKLLRLPRCEALVFVPMHHFARFVGQADVEATLDVLFGTKDWRKARAMSDIKERLAFLVDLFQEQLKVGGARWTRAFEIVPLKGGNSHFLFFATSNPTGLAKMKTAMWKLDPAGGQRFRDSTNVDDPVLFDPSPDYEALLRLLKDHFGDREFSVEEAEDFTLFETPFLHDAHLKQKTLAPAERSDQLEPVKAKSDRRKCSFPPKTTVRFVSGEEPPGDNGA